MKILITGANGFIGKNLIVELRNRGYHELYLCDRGTTEKELEQYTKDCEFVFHLAGINRPEHIEDFMTGNWEPTKILIKQLRNNKNRAPVLVSSSIQAKLDNPYGKSKLATETSLIKFHQECGNPIYICRLHNVFGKWCKPNYNSVVATFCYKISREEKIEVHDPNKVLTLVYIDDVVTEFIHYMEPGNAHSVNFFSISVQHTITLQELEDKIRSFHVNRKSIILPDMANILEKKLYSTYLSYLPKDSFSYPLKMNVDERGSFTEFLRSKGSGQISVNILKSGVTKGNHWHHTKNEKFLVVKGTGVIRFRKVDSDEITEYHVSGESFEVVDIPPGYTHNISNVGNEEMVTVMWANEVFDSVYPDTYYEKVDIKTGVEGN